MEHRVAPVMENRGFSKIRGFCDLNKGIPGIDLGLNLFRRCSINTKVRIPTWPFVLFVLRNSLKILSGFANLSVFDRFSTGLRSVFNRSGEPVRFFSCPFLSHVLRSRPPFSNLVGIEFQPLFHHNSFQQRLDDDDNDDTILAIKTTSWRLHPQPKAMDPASVPTMIGFPITFPKMMLPRNGEISTLASLVGLTASPIWNGTAVNRAMIGMRSTASTPVLCVNSMQEWLPLTPLKPTFCRANITEW